MVEIILRGHGRFSPETFFAVLVVVCIVAIYQAYFSANALIRQGIKNAAVTRIADVKAGQIVKISGKIFIAGRTVRTPLTGRECVYYTIEVTQRTGKSRRTIIKEKGRGDIVLYDGSGYALIRDHKAQAIVFPDGRFTSGLGDDALPEMEAFLRKHKTKSTGILGFNKNLHYDEGILEEGEQCIVVGKATWMKRSATKLKLPVEEVLVISSAPNVDCYISDDPELVNGN